MNGDINIIVVTAIAAYLIITTAIGIVLKNKVKCIQEFFVAKKNLGLLLIIPLLFGEHAAGASTVGNAADGFRYGLSSTWAVLGIAFSCFLLSGPVLKFYRAMGTQNIITIPGILETRFDKKTRVVLMCIILLVTSILFALQPLAAASILAPIFNMDITPIAWIVSAIFILVTTTGGLKGIAWMNLVHAIVMYIAMVIVFLASIKSVGGLGIMSATLPKTYFSFLQPNFFTILGWFLGSALSMMVSAPNVGIALGAKTMKDARGGFIIGGSLLIPFAIITSFIGISAKIAVPNVAPNTALYSMANNLGSVYSSLISICIIAAVFSTAPAILLAISTTITKDFYSFLINKNATENQQMIVAKASIIIIGLVATYFGLQSTSILAQILGAAQIRAIAGVVIIAAMFWKRFDSNAAFWSLLGGGSTAAIWHFAGSPYNIVPLWPALLVCLVIMIPMTFLSKQPIADGYLYVEEGIKKLLEEESLISSNNKHCSQ